MSLIIEALKRARDDAVRRQAAARGLPLAPVPRMRGRSRWLSFALVPLAAALVVCILLLIDLSSRIPEPPAPLESREQAARFPEPGEEPAAAETPLLLAQEIESAAQDPVSTSPRSGPAPAVRSASAMTVRPVADEVAPPAEESVARQPTRQGPAAERPASQASRDAREFVGQAELLDGQLVDLEGIAWSESEPFALLNGQVIGVGELIRAYRVTEITQNLVMLEKGDDRVVVRLK